MEIAGRKIGAKHPCFIVAELSGNHRQNVTEAMSLITAAKDCGADAVKVQTYNPDEMFDKDDVVQGFGPPWDGMIGLELYNKTYLPWSWHSFLKTFAENLGIILFTTVFSEQAVDYLELHAPMPAYKVAAWQVGNTALLTYVASKKKPTIISSSSSEEAWKAYWPGDVAFLAKDSLEALEKMKKLFECPVGFSNHGPVAQCVEAVQRGASIVEEHFTLSREAIDGKFAAMPTEFKEMVVAIREADKA